MNVSLGPVVAPAEAWPAELVGVAQPAMRRALARTPPPREHARPPARISGASISALNPNTRKRCCAAPEKTDLVDGVTTGSDDPQRHQARKSYLTAREPPRPSARIYSSVGPELNQNRQAAARARRRDMRPRHGRTRVSRYRRQQNPNMQKITQISINELW